MKHGLRFKKPSPPTARPPGTGGPRTAPGTAAPAASSVPWGDPATRCREHLCRGLRLPVHFISAQDHPGPFAAKAIDSFGVLTAWIPSSPDCGSGGADMGYELRQKTDKQVSAGGFYPLGASLAPDGVNFALYSQNAYEVFLLLFETPDGEPTDIIRLETRTRYIWHAFVHGLKAGQLYGYRVHGEFNPARGLRFNQSKLLIDPYAKALTGKAQNRDNLLLAYDPEAPDRDLSQDGRDNAAVVPKCMVVEDRFDWQDDAPPDIPPEKLIIYEVHLKGFTAHPSSQVAHPGTYLGFIQKIPHLKELGVNAVEFLPIHEHYVE